MHAQKMALGKVFTVGLLAAIGWSTDGVSDVLAAETPVRQDDAPRAVIDQTAENGVMFRTLHVKRDPARHLLVIAIYTDNIDREGNVCRHRYAEGADFIVDGRLIHVMREDEFRTGSQSGQAHTVMEWFANYEEGSRLANASTVGFQVKCGFSPNPKTLKFENLPVRDIRPAAKSESAGRRFPATSPTR